MDSSQKSTLIIQTTNILPLSSRLAYKNIVKTIFFNYVIKFKLWVVCLFICLLSDIEESKAENGTCKRYLPEKSLISFKHLDQEQKRKRTTKANLVISESSKVITKKSLLGRHFYGTDDVIWAGFGLVGNTENKLGLIMSNFCEHFLKFSSPMTVQRLSNDCPKTIQ